MPPTAAQAEFICPDPSGKDVIHVDVLIDSSPDLRTWSPMVSDGPAWSIRQSGVRRCLCLGEPSTVSPAGLVACWQDEVTQATVYSGPDYVRARGTTLEMCNTAGYPVDQVLLMYYLASRGGLLVHGAGAVADGRALIFPGVSGAGKTTLTRQLLANGWAQVLSDDRVIVRSVDGHQLAYGTPWPGDARVALNASAPLAAILFLARGTETHITPLSPQQALHRLLPATSILWHEPQLLLDQLAVCERLLGDIPAYELSWLPDGRVVAHLQQFLSQR